MSAIDEAPDCVCGDPRVEHKRGTGGCKDPDCGCAKYDPGDRAAPSEPRPTPHLDRVKKERDEALAAEARVKAYWTNAAQECDAARRELDKVRGELTAARRQVNEAVEAEGIALERVAALRRERDEARAELESVRVQLDQAEARCRDIQDEELPAAIDEATAQLRAELADRADKLLLEQAKTAKLRRRLARINAAERLYDEHVRHLCRVCGSRYRELHNHPCGPLVPVRVRITFIKE
ncbi:hypothetical protein [Actinoplanes siamensis]|uniref:Uncharacterized protein n=1 Tax=Actinoplanes siamensis TaxID=1223317 RepID=A0A919ND97_9ACTN|nr:hypothetical protein [Actinoplanes siamensis]GIF08702.1 hypothetical protein Asi03nite_62400 [Actinoplanes siamensis]